MRVLAVAAWIYMGALVLFAIMVLAIGELWWVGTMALYLPRLPLLLPLLLFLPLARKKDRRVVLAIQAAVAIALVLVMSGPHISFAHASGTKVRVFSYNVYFAWRGVDAIDREVGAANADVLVFQAMKPSVADRLRDRFGPEWHYHGGEDEFFIASRFPIVATGKETIGRQAFRQYTLETPLGTVDVINMHPYSPRSAINELRGESRRILKGKASDESVEEVEANTDRRQEQIAAIAAAAGAATHPLVIAGDSNLPEHSTLFAQYFSRWQDGFASAGTGFGYTFPAHHLFPWMRIDRILASQELRFTSFSVGGRGGSDHCPVWADLEKR
jgi:endonuclease/exonuclease/phosphatase family metal-dependent hydrolase